MFTKYKNYYSMAVHIYSEISNIKSMILDLRKDIDKATKKTAVAFNDSMKNAPIMYIGPENRVEEHKLRAKDPKMFEYITEVLRLYLS